MKGHQAVHLAGVGDFSVTSMTFLPDPCPLPEGVKKRTLVEKDKSIYAPMSGVGGIVYDKDAVYIDLGGTHAHDKKADESDFVQNIINTETTINDKLQESELRLFSGSKPIKSGEIEPTSRRKAVFDAEDGSDEDSDIDSDIEPPKKKIRNDSESLSKNQQLLKEIGDDIGEDTDESDFEDSDAPKSLNLSSEKISSQRNLASEKDKKILSKISDALSNIKDPVSSEEESEAEESDQESEEEENGNESDDELINQDSDEEAEESLKWKSDLAMKARDSFYARQSGTTSLRKLVYGAVGESATNGDDSSDDEIGGLFTVQKSKNSSAKKELDAVDSSLWSVEHIQDWEREDIRQRIKDCFVTGQWAKGKDAEELLKLDDEEEVYGDFEDLETGEVVEGEQEEKEDQDEDQPRKVNLGGEREAELEKRKQRMERKLKLKKMFDSEYDGGEGDKASFYEDLKKEVDDQSNLNKNEFDGMDDSLRVQYEGFRPGMYVRLELEHVPCEMINQLSPSTPLLMGGLLKGEDQLGYCQVRIKKHRWYPRILKNKDPLIVSLGWRRFQTLPIYSVCDHNMRHRMLKYTPEHLHCDAHFWGPTTPQGTGMMAVQSVADKH